MANQDLIVRIIGDSRSLENAYKRSTVAGKNFERQTDRTIRGVIAGSGAFRSLGRSVAFASTAFLGGVGFAAALRSSVKAAQEQQVALRAAAAQLKASGLAWSTYSAQIDKATGSMTRLGIEDDQALAAFTTLFRATNNVTKAINDLQLVADIAAARHIDLQKAALLVAKVEAGNTGVLRRYGVVVSKTASVEQALALARQRFTGQAAANVTAQQRFSATLDRTQEIIGSALLPVLNKYLGRASDWLEQSQNQEKIQRDVTAVVEATTKAVHVLTVAVGALATAWKEFSTLGGLLPGKGGTVNLPVGVTVEQIRTVRDQFAKAFGEGDLRVKALDAAIEKLNKGSLDRLIKGLEQIESVRGGRFAASGGGGGGGGGGAGGAFSLPFRLQREQAFAATTQTIRDDLAVAVKIRNLVNKMIASGQVKGKGLLDALAALANANGLIAQAQKDAADKQRAAAQKQAEAVKKHAEAVKAAAEKQRQAAQEAADRLRAATDQARSEIGTLFQGPVLAPTEAARKAALGVPGPDPGKILADIRAQTAQALRFEADLKRLGKPGVGGSTIEELRGLGTGALPQIEAILGAPAGQRGQLIKALAARERAAQRIGQMIVHTPNVTLHARRVVVAGGRQAQSTARSGRFAGRE